MALILLTDLVACASSRTLSQEEMSRLGLTGVAYDIPLCPNEFDPVTRKTKITGPCEHVTCEAVGQTTQLACRARK